jgi:hypothetical protein
VSARVPLHRRCSRLTEWTTVPNKAQATIGGKLLGSLLGGEAVRILLLEVVVLLSKGKEVVTISKTSLVH